MNNKRTGNKFEREFADFLKKQGYWVHLLTPNQNGQPADLIAVRGAQIYLIDCKVCQNDSFNLSRIEDNQWTAMKQFNKCGNGYSESLFALKIKSGEVYLFLYDTMADLRKNDVKSLNLSDILSAGEYLTTMEGIDESNSK